MSREPIHGYMFKRGGMWHYEVMVGDTVIAYDNCRLREKLIESCRERVAAFRIVLGLGYTLEPSFGWSSLVERAGAEL